jgi:hypothetical protein
LKKLPYLFFTAYIAFAIMGTFSFAVVDTLRSVHFTAKNPTLDSPDNYVVRQQAEELTIITKTSRNQFSPLRMGSQRAASLFGSSGGNFSRSPFKAGEKTQYTNVKNNILLKLRI